MPQLRLIWLVWSKIGKAILPPLENVEIRVF
jgi:hypothetical protein